MSKSLIPVLPKELQGFESDLDNHRASLKNLKAYAKDLDPQMIPHFVAGVSEAIDATDSCEDADILVFEILARMHGPKIVPSIGKIMSIIMKALSSSAGSVSKIVSAIALYGIDPLALDKEKMKIIQSICKPLSDALMSSEGNVSSGAAACIKGLVNLDVWRFASNEIVNEICLKVTGALGEAPTQTNSHFGLVIDLAKHNSLVLEAYARSIIRSGLQILSKRLEDNTSQKFFSAIQMINFLMRCIDARSFSSEIERIIKTMERSQNDHFPCVQGAAFEALQSAKLIAAHGELRNNLRLDSITGSDFDRVCNEEPSWIVPDYGTNSNGSPHEIPTHESKPLLYDSFVCSAISSEQSSCNVRCVRHANKKMWNADIDGKDGEKKDAIFHQVGFYGNASMAYFEHCRNSELKEETQEFRTPIESSNSSSSNLLAESASNSAKRSWPIADVRKASALPARRLIPSLKSSRNCTVRNHDRSDFCMLRSSSSKDEVCMLPHEFDHHDLTHRRAISDNLNLSKEQLIHNGHLGGGDEVSSSYHGNALASDAIQTCIKTSLKENNNSQTVNLRNINASKVPFSLICALSLIFLIIILARSITIHEVPSDVVPT